MKSTGSLPSKKNFEKNNSLKDLIDESGKSDNYREAQGVFKTKKIELISQVEKLIDL